MSAASTASIAVPASTDAVGAAGANEAQALVDVVYTRLKTEIESRRLTAATLTILITIGMTAVDKAPALSGPQKKELVLHVLTRLVGEIPDNEDRETAQLLLVFAPSAIDALVSAAKGQLFINDGRGDRSACGGCDLL